MAEQNYFWTILFNDFQLAPNSDGPSRNITDTNCAAAT